LIPRPETELIVDLVKRDFVESEFVLGADFGSGSGCLAIAITRQLPDCQMKAVECSESAFPLLARNLETQGRGKVQMLECKVQELNGKIAESSLDMIVANPPYIAQGDTYVGEQVHKFEPHVALYSEDQGKKDIKDWLAVAKGKLKSGGRYYFEIGWRQEGFVTNLLKESEGWNLLEIVKDYSDHPRVVVCKRL
jgi:release factor glutamine methyltransferase